MWEDVPQQARSLNASDQDKLDAILEWTNEGLLEHTDAFVQLSVELLERQNQVKMQHCTDSYSVLLVADRMTSFLGLAHCQECACTM
jgi:hypothetical protein